MESWEVTWTDAEGREHRKEFAGFLDAWTFNEQTLKGRGEVVLLTDRLVHDREKLQTEAQQVRRFEGRGRRRG